MSSHSAYPDGAYPDEPRGWSPLAVAVIATLVLLLGLGGALFGIWVANTNAAAASGQTIPQGFPTPSFPTPSSPTPTATASTTQPPTPSPSVTTPPDSFALPDLTGLDFQSARTKVRELKLGWRLEFEGAEADPLVRATEPAANALVTKGTTVKIFVRGAAPPATVPDVEGLSCSDAAALVVDHGLYPQYPTGRTGVVQAQSPEASDPQTLHWNDEVTLTCG